MEDLRRETELQRGDLMALENARLDQLFSKALSLFVKGKMRGMNYSTSCVLLGTTRRCLIGIGATTQ